MKDKSNRNWQTLLTYLYYNKCIRNFDDKNFNPNLLVKYPKNYFPTELEKLWPENLRKLFNPIILRSEKEPGEIIAEEKGGRRYQFLIKFINNPKNIDLSDPQALIEYFLKEIKIKQPAVNFYIFKEDEVKIMNDFHLWISFNYHLGWKKTEKDFKSSDCIEIKGFNRWTEAGNKMSEFESPFRFIQKEKPDKQKSIKKNTKKDEKPQDKDSIDKPQKKVKLK